MLNPTHLALNSKRDTMPTQDLERMNNRLITLKMLAELMSLEQKKENSNLIKDKINHRCLALLIMSKHKNKMLGLILSEQNNKSVTIRIQDQEPMNNK